jgi:predicted RNA-binding protein with PIN domain
MMKFLPFVPSLLFACRGRATWFIDGNNVMGKKGIPKDRAMVTEKLQEINQRNTGVVLVWDGAKGVHGEHTQCEKMGDDFTIVTTKEGLTADDYILSEIKAIVEAGIRNHAVHLVTADRRFRRRALASKGVCKQVVNPVVFWRRYRLRLAGLKHKDPS